MHCPCVSHWPMSSAKPPRGSLQVPVTNCMSRSRTSLSTSFTSWRGGRDKTYNDNTLLTARQPADSLTHSSKGNMNLKQHLQASDMCLSFILHRRSKSRLTHSVCVCMTVPARTRWFVCCSSCSGGTLCSSASPAGLPPAFHTASPVPKHIPSCLRVAVENTLS